ncbi:MAG: hypothetical protein IKA49_05460 [Alistipes sp.]|nr:hypothetical protein [Alistipes sp.]
MKAQVWILILAGLIFAFLAFVVYRLSLRDALREFDNHFGIVYEMMKLLHTGVGWLRTLLNKEP